MSFQLLYPNGRKSPIRIAFVIARTDEAPKNDGYEAPKGDGYGAPKGDGYGAPKGDGYGAPKGDGYGAPKGGGYGAISYVPIYHRTADYLSP